MGFLGSKDDHYFHPFSTNIEGISLPEKFTFPLFYTPHPLAKIAAEELQNYLENQNDFVHNFGIDMNAEGMIIGKMFGVLVVKNKEGKLGYLAAFSGKLANANHHKGFVPPVFDMLTDNSFFLEKSKPLWHLNAEIERLENNPEYQNLLRDQKQYDIDYEHGLKTLKADCKVRKKIRDAKRKEDPNNELLLQELIRESQLDNIKQVNYRREGEAKKIWYRDQISRFEAEIEPLKTERRERSSNLQSELFDQYTFLNARKETKSLLKIFGANPPAGAGECAAPKLLHFAFLHDMQPIALAEFWWGQSPKSEVREHKQFYPACKSKCEPILNHMLSATETDPNPLLQNDFSGKELKVIYEDEYFAAIHKPADFLSVPGISIRDSVAERMKLKYPDATGPLIVHRLDMATSGLLLIAKSKEAHEKLQSLFIRRKVKKRYVAILEGVPAFKHGHIKLPLRVDLDDRPRQLVCYEYGKPAHTEYELVEVKDGRARVHFYPHTGRTHQLRMHAAHRDGLHCPIVGDDLYGNSADRLYLHAAELQFIHPYTKEEMKIVCEPEF